MRQTQTGMTFADLQDLAKAKRGALRGSAQHSREGRRPAVPLHA
jgi:hypothetical protein